MPTASGQWRTFLFTDIEGSTRLWENHPAAMRVALARHDAILRTAIEAAGGTVFKTVGDAFHAVFRSPNAALQAALAAQRALILEPWPDPLTIRVRMALHAGPWQERDGDFFGPSLNRAARLLSIGHGGQTLLSEMIKETLDRLPPSVTLEDRGRHRLKDLSEGLPVWEVHHPDLPSDFPPLRSLATEQTNLPVQTSSFVGRAQEMLDIRRLLPTTRLLTLTGIGGTGKTRLALQAAAERVEDYADGVWLAELAPVLDPSLVAQTVGGVLDIRSATETDPARILLDYLRDKEMLLVLDNCEHVLGAVSPLVASLLRTCPRLRLLATSREPLGVPGEQVYALLPLPVYDAARLFVERATQMQPNFAVAPNAPVLARVCHRLDGIPLAIELAAARIRALTVEQIEERLNDRFRLLTGGSRAALPRQQTLRALIDWSHDLLSESERMLFRRLSVFVGGGTLEAVEAVCGGEHVEEWEIIDLLAALVDKSLILAEEQPTGMRYRMLETLREYAREQLEVSDEREAFRRRHADYWFAFAKQRRDEKATKTDLDEYEREHDNLRTALDWYAANPDGAFCGMTLCSYIGLFWQARGYYREGRTRCDIALAHPGATDEGDCQANCLNIAGILCYFQADYRAAAEYYEKALALYRRNGDQNGIAIISNNLGSLYSDQDELDRALTLFEEALAVRRAMEDRQKQVGTLVNIGNIYERRDEYRASVPFYEEAYRLAVEVAYPIGQLYASECLTFVAWHEDDLSDMRRWLREAIPLCRELRVTQMTASLLTAAAYLAIREQRWELATRLFGAQEVIRERHNMPLEDTYQAEYQQQRGAVCMQLGEAAFHRSLAEGTSLSAEDALAEALRLAEADVAVPVATRQAL